MRDLKRVILTLIVVTSLVAMAVPLQLNPEALQGSEWHIETVDSADDVGQWSSLALDSRGFPHITYGDRTNGNLKYAKWMGDHWQIETVDSDDNVGKISSLDLDGRDYAHISYNDEKKMDLKYATWTGIEWRIDIVDSVGDLGDMNSLALDSNDIPHISYANIGPAQDLKYARWTGTHWVNETVDWEGNVGWQNSIDIDSQDRPHISYNDKSNQDVKYTRWDGKKWINETVDAVGVFGGPFLALDSKDKPHLTYSKAGEVDLMYAHFDGTKWHKETVDWIGNVGDYPSIAVDGNDYPHIAHTDLDNDDLKYAWFDGTKWHNETVDSYGSVGWDTSVAIDANGHPHVSYYNKSSGDLKYATKAKLGSDSPPVADAGPDQSVDVSVVVQFDGGGSYDPDSGWENFTIDSDGDTGGYVSIAVDVSGNSHISYFEFTKRLLKYARWDGAKWTDQVVDLAGHIYPHTSIALDSSGYPHISYNGGDVLKHAWWDGTTWTNETVDSAGIVGRYGSIALDSNDRPHISYNEWTNRDLKYARWNGSSWNIEVVDSVGSVGTWVSLALDDSDYPHISYLDHTHGDLKYARWDGSAWTNETVDSEGYVGRATSIALDSVNRPRISFQQYSDRDLRFASWANGSWFVEKVDFQGDLAHSTSLALDSNDRPHISYNDFLQGDVKYARWDGIGWWIQTVESAGDVGESSSIAIDENDGPHMSYYDKTNGNLDYVSKSGAGLTYDWDFGDGSPHGSGPDPTHVYTFPGAFLVTLTVTDSLGATDTDDCTITVLQNGQPPVADAGPDQTVDEGDIVQFDGSGSSGSNGGTYDWEVLANMSIPRMGLAAAAIGSKIYATGGFLGDAGQPPLRELYTREVEIYDTAKDEWSIGTPMIHNRSSHGAGAVSGKVYVMGGTDYIVMSPPGALVSTEEYDPVADKWEYKSSMLTPRSRFGTAVVDGKIYTIGGWWTPVMGIWTKSNATEAYDPATDTWTRLSRMPTARGEVALAVLDRKIYAMGGSGGWDVIEIYDVDTDTWTTGPSIPSNATSYYGMTAEVLDGRIYLMGGVGMDCVKSVVVSYDPAADEWRWEPVMNYARSDHASVTIGNAIYVMGGTYGWMCGNRAPAERFVGMSELDYEWDFDANVDSDGDGNYTNDVDATGEAPTHVYGDNGNYTVTLKVTDNAGLSDTDTCLITVLNVPPTADANGPYQGFEGTPIHFNGSQTDPGANDTHTYEWDFNYDGTTFTPDATGNPNQKTWHDDYTGSIALKVTDDDGGWDLDVTTVTIVNVPPRAEAGEDKEGYEASTFIFNGSFYDPGSNDTHECAWDFDYDGISFDVEATGQSVSHTFVDDFDGEIALRVTDDDGGVGIDTAHVLVKNVPPTVTLEVLPIEVDAFLRIAGEKWHDVSIELYEDGILMANGTLVRYPGSPDDQMLDLSSLKFDHSMKYSATIRYTPDDDPINGQPNGANPCWIILRFSDGQELWIHHTFNVQHPDTYVWEVDLTAAILSHGMTFEAIAFDPGADELTFHWDFGDGTNATSFYPNGNGTCPVTITEIINHIFPGSGTYVVVLTVEDDDGGVGTASLTIVIP